MCHKQSLQLAGLLVAAVLVCNQGPAQTPDKQPTTGKSFYSQLNEQARIERSGDASAIPVVAHGAFENLGIPTDIADAFGLTARIVHAQQSYRAGTQPAAHEEDLVKAWNNFANSLGAPAWAHTTKPEIRKLRMRMLVVLPQLFACQEPPDAKGHYRVLSPNMSPLEASFLALTMIHMKAFNEEFQFSDVERSENQKRDPASVADVRSQRTKMLLDIAEGRSDSVSVRDVLAAGDHLFSDLGMQDNLNSGMTAPPSPKPSTVAAKGGF